MEEKKESKTESNPEEKTQPIEKIIEDIESAMQKIPPPPWPERETRHSMSASEKGTANSLRFIVVVLLCL